MARCTRSRNVCRLAWRNAAYLAAGNTALPRRFDDEARASLPVMGMAEGAPSLNEIYDAIGLQRLRLHRDQQVPEWAG